MVGLGKKTSFVYDQVERKEKKGKITPYPLSFNSTKFLFDLRKRYCKDVWLEISRGGRSRQ